MYTPLFWHRRFLHSQKGKNMTGRATENRTTLQLPDFEWENENFHENYRKQSCSQYFKEEKEPLSIQLGCMVGEKSASD